MRYAKSLYGISDIAVFSEFSLEHPNLPGLRPIAGKSDFITAQVGGYLPLCQFGSMVGATRPRLLVVEAKREATMPELSSQAQLFAELITLDYEDHMAL